MEEAGVGPSYSGRWTHRGQLSMQLSAPQKRCEPSYVLGVAGRYVALVACCMRQDFENC